MKFVLIDFKFLCNLNGPYTASMLCQLNAELTLSTSFFHAFFLLCSIRICLGMRIAVLDTDTKSLLLGYRFQNSL